MLYCFLTLLYCYTTHYPFSGIGVSTAAGLCLFSLVILIIAYNRKVNRLKTIELGPMRMTFNTTSTTNTTMARSLSEPILFAPELHSTTVEPSDPQDHQNGTESPIAHRLRPRI